MIFDRLWWAERRHKEKEARLKAQYQPKLEEAKRAKDQKAYAEILNEWYVESKLDDACEGLRSHKLVEKARKLGISIPAQPPLDDNEALDTDENWNFNEYTGSLTLNEAAEFKLRRDIRKEEMEKLQHQMRWVSQVVIPLIGLLGTMMGLIALLHALR